MPAYIIIDLGFGDAGKGLLTDALARQTGASLVIRYNGGTQAGHHVVTATGQEHTFSQFGSATFVAGVRTFLSRHMVIHPTGLLAEGDLLTQKGVPDAYTRLRMSENALVITPFHQAANRLRELGRGDGRHGSCGVGVGEAVEDASLHAEDSISAADLLDSRALAQKLKHVRERKREELKDLLQHFQAGSAGWKDSMIFEQEEVIERWMAVVRRIGLLGLVTPDETLQKWLAGSETILFEGAQGVLLDAEAGFHPYTTWSDCTCRNAIELLDQWAPAAEVTRLGVLRCYTVRHGPGPLPSETHELDGVIRENNQTNDWQGRVRYGWFDSVLARYALAVNGRVDGLAITHLDVPAAQGKWTYCRGYRNFGAMPEKPLAEKPLAMETSEGLLKSFSPLRPLSMPERVQLTNALEQVTCELASSEADENTILAVIGSLLKHPVVVSSTGRAARNVKILQAGFFGRQLDG